MIEIDQKMVVDSLNEVAATDAGKIVFAYLKDACQWDTTYLASDNPSITHFHAVKRGVYGGLRNVIRPEYLKQIEFNYKRKIDDDRTHQPRRESKLTASQPATTSRKPAKQ